LFANKEVIFPDKETATALVMMQLYGEELCAPPEADLNNIATAEMIIELIKQLSSHPKKHSKKIPRML